VGPNAALLSRVGSLLEQVVALESGEIFVW
jgi:hypothetical protein